MLPGARTDLAGVYAEEFNGKHEYDFIMNCRCILGKIKTRLQNNLDSLRVYTEKLVRCVKLTLFTHRQYTSGLLRAVCAEMCSYKVFAMDLDVLKPPIDEIELVRFCERF